MTVLASVLAVIGYSINDKVVVFDRIRELFRLARKAEPEEILNRSINTRCREPSSPRCSPASP